MNCTIVVVPRERFRPLPESLNSLFQTIDTNIPVVVVDGGAPDDIRRQLEVIQSKREFDWVKPDQFIRPSRARNIGLERSKTKYTVFCDNDLKYHDGWLTALLNCAEDSGAAAVCPTTLIGPSDPQIIHHAGGYTWLQRDSSGNIRLREKHRFGNEKLNSITDEQMNDKNFVCQNFEYHCVLLNTKIMKAIGGVDERLIRREHLDTSLRFLANGHTIAFEPKSKVMYEVFTKFKPEDRPYFLFRWSAKKSDETAELFSENWRVYEPKESEQSGFLQRHRERAMATLLPKLKGLPKRNSIRSMLLKYLVRPYVHRFEPRVVESTDIVMLPQPAIDALERAGINFTPPSN